MEHQYAEENNFAARYVIGRLSPEESVPFEEHFVDCPQCLADIETEREVVAGLKTVAARNAVAERVPSPMRWRPHLAWAAGLVILASITWWGLRQEAGKWAALYGQEKDARQALERRLAQSEAQPAAAAPIFALVTTRSADTTDSPNRIPLPTSPQWMVLALDRGGLPAFPAYRVRLLDSAGQVVWTGDRLRSVSPETLGIGLNSRLLREGAFVLAIDGLTPDGRAVPAGRYRFLCSQGR